MLHYILFSHILLLLHCLFQIIDILYKLLNMLSMSLTLTDPDFFPEEPQSLTVVSALHYFRNVLLP